MAKASSQKQIGLDRAPRVHITTDVEVGDARPKVSLPFVMGVMADLSGKPADPLKPVDEREFRDIDANNFDSVLKGSKPRVQFTVPNTLTGEGNLPVDVTFESMDDFSPAALARKIEPLRNLLEAREKLADLLGRVDGMSQAEDLLGKILGDAELMKKIAEAGNKGG